MPGPALQAAIGQFDETFDPCDRRDRDGTAEEAFCLNQPHPPPGRRQAPAQTGPGGDGGFTVQQDRAGPGRANMQPAVPVQAAPARQARVAGDDPCQGAQGWGRHAAS